MGSLGTSVTYDTILAAHQRIKPFIRKTPIFNVSHVKNKPPHACDLYLKLEQHQLTGSFKIRGVTNKILSLSDKQLQSGIVAASGGNHGRAVAYAGWERNLPVTIYLPNTTPEHKVEAIKKWNAKIIIAGSDLDEANKIALQATEENSNGIFIHPYADPIVVNGQGTLGIDLLADLKNLDVLILAIGGGGLIAGVSTAVKAMNPNIRIIGVEPTGCPTMHASIKAGKVVTVPTITTKVGTLAIRCTTELNFHLAQQNVDDIVLVTDDEMQLASTWLWDELGIASELSGAASLAALLGGKIEVQPHERVCPVICGLGVDGINVTQAPGL